MHFNLLLQGLRSVFTKTLTTFLIYLNGQSDIQIIWLELVKLVKIFLKNNEEVSVPGLGPTPTYKRTDSEEKSAALNNLSTMGSAVTQSGHQLLPENVCIVSDKSLLLISLSLTFQVKHERVKLVKTWKIDFRNNLKQAFTTKRHQEKNEPFRENIIHWWI